MTIIHDVSDGFPAPPLPVPSQLRDQMHREYQRALRLRGNAPLHDELESRRWQLAGILSQIEADPESWKFGSECVQLHRFKIAEIEALLAERKRLHHHAEAPAWHEGNRRRCEAVKALAETIKRNVQIDWYCIVVGIELLRAGSDEMRGRCPFHGGRSFTVSPAKNVWNCFGCGEGGDIIDLHEALSGLSTFAEVVEDLGRLVGIAPPAQIDPFTTPTNYSPRSQTPRYREERNNPRPRTGVQVVGGEVVNR